MIRGRECVSGRPPSLIDDAASWAAGYTANNALNYGGNGISATDHAHAGAGMFAETLVTDSSAATFHANNLHESNRYMGGSRSTANPYIFFCGMLMAQWSFTGYDASAHMVEETQNAAMAGPQGIMRALSLNAVFGFAYIIALISSVQDYMNSFFGPLALNYNPVSQIMWDVFEDGYGDGRYACGLWIILVWCGCAPPLSLPHAASQPHGRPPLVSPLRREGDRASLPAACSCAACPA